MDGYLLGRLETSAACSYRLRPVTCKFCFTSVLVPSVLVSSGPRRFQLVVQLVGCAGVGYQQAEREFSVTYLADLVYARGGLFGGA